MSKRFHIDDLETGRIQNIDFETYENGMGSFRYYGLNLDKEEFDLLKKAGGICGGNNRSENERVAATILNILKRGNGGNI